MVVTDIMPGDLAVRGCIRPTALRIWAAREGLEAKCSREGERLIAHSSGSPGCFGGWDIVFPVQGGQHYRVGLSYATSGMASVLDGMPIFVFWTDDEDKRVDYDYLVIHEPDSPAGRAERVFRCPDDATRAVLRCGVRWTATGRAEFSDPAVEAVEAPPRRVHRIAVAAEAPSSPASVADNVRQYVGLAREAAELRPDLVLMPEIILQLGLPSPAYQHSITIPGPETEAFAAVAAEHEMMIAFSTMEADSDLYFNTLVLFGPDGAILGTYRKTHLAVMEGWEGTTPGDELPVIDTPIGRVACTICKDSSIVEASRVPAMRGAEVMLLPIMGDHRAVQWGWAPGTFSPDRWKVIMRARAMENHMWLVVARNNREGSCIVSPSGDILAWNDGRQRIIVAECDIGERLRTFRGSTFADSTWAERRPHLYC
ncbi:MAG: carbon-nitrogen hydrolase family protein [Armatimonadota bacterium]